MAEAAADMLFDCLFNVKTLTVVVYPGSKPLRLKFGTSDRSDVKPLRNGAMRRGEGNQVHRFDRSGNSKFNFGHMYRRLTKPVGFH